MSEGRRVWNTDHEALWSLETEQLISWGRSHCRTRCWTLSPAGKPTDLGPGGKLSSTKFTLFCKGHGLTLSLLLAEARASTLTDLEVLAKALREPHHAMWTRGTLHIPSLEVTGMAGMGVRRTWDGEARAQTPRQAVRVGCWQ